MSNDHHCCRVVRQLVEDLPGQHTWVFVCRECRREFGPEWVQPHRWPDDPRAPDPFDLPRWTPPDTGKKGAA